MNGFPLLGYFLVFASEVHLWAHEYYNTFLIIELISSWIKANAKSVTYDQLTE